MSGHSAYKQCWCTGSCQKLQVSYVDVYVQKEVDEIQRLMNLEKEKVEMAQQKTLNQIRTSCAKVIL